MQSVVGEWACPRPRSFRLISAQLCPLGCAGSRSVVLVPACPHLFVFVPTCSYLSPLVPACPRLFLLVRARARLLVLPDSFALAPIHLHLFVGPCPYSLRVHSLLRPITCTHSPTRRSSPILALCPFTVARSLAPAHLCSIAPCT
jgi:hypothetical protein